MQQCKRCGAFKAVDQFGVDAERGFRLRACKDCVKEQLDRDCAKEHSERLLIAQGIEPAWKQNRVCTTCKKSKPRSEFDRNPDIYVRGPKKGQVIPNRNRFRVHRVCRDCVNKLLAEKGREKAKKNQAIAKDRECIVCHVVKSGRLFQRDLTKPNICRECVYKAANSPLNKALSMRRRTCKVCGQERSRNAFPSGSFVCNTCFVFHESNPKARAKCEGKTCKDCRQHLPLKRFRQYRNEHYGHLVADTCRRCANWWRLNGFKYSDRRSLPKAKRSAFKAAATVRNRRIDDAARRAGLPLCKRLDW